MSDESGSGYRPRHARLATVAGDTAPHGNVLVIAAELTAVRCRWCHDELEHCHDSLVVHSSGEALCMNGLCLVSSEAHHMVLGCDELGCACREPLEVANTA